MTKFWKPLLAIALICALALAGLGLAAQSPAAAAQAERADEFRAVWVARCTAWTTPVRPLQIQRSSSGTPTRFYRDVWTWA